MSELENQTTTTNDTEVIVENKTDETKNTKPEVPEVVTPSLEEVLALLAANGSESLMQLAPVKELIQTARKQEKDKLYKSIEQKEKEAKDLAEKLEKAQEAVQKHETDNLSFEEKLQKQVEALQLEHEKLVQGLQAEKEKAEKEAKAKSLEAYMAKQLRVAGDDLILELVGGNSEEEIDASIEKAKAKYQEIASKFASKQKEEDIQSVKDTFAPSNPSSSTVKPLTKEEINRMSPEEYAKNRDRIMQALRDGVID